MKEILDLSLICCYNNKKQLEDEMLKSYNEQNAECEVILVDNRNHTFPSAASALNHGASLAKTNNILFIHQDIVFLDENVLKNIYNEIIKKDTIIGVAGVKENGKAIWTSILHGKYKEKAGLERVEKIEEVIAVDECLFGMKKCLFEKVKFDDVTCDNWHFYAVDLCYSASYKGIKSYVVPANVWHTSTGHKTSSFYEALKKMKSKHKDKRGSIKSCCINAKINEPIIYIRVYDYFKTNYAELKKKIKRILKI